MNLIAICGGSFLTLTIYKILNSNGIYLGFVPAVLVWLSCYWLIKTIVKQFTNKKVVVAETVIKDFKETAPSAYKRAMPWRKYVKKLRREQPRR